MRTDCPKLTLITRVPELGPDLPDRNAREGAHGYPGVAIADYKCVI